MSVGEVVAINGLLLQLSVPFNFIGYTYQELRQVSPSSPVSSRHP
jgi:ABC-type transport system involved in Fe-S cluster assembly fused permease/ATPase subunit